MAQYSIGEAEEITGVKAYVLRYWEQVMPFFSPKKDAGGRRVYSQKEIDIIQRLKYLIYEKKFTIEGARGQLIADLDAYETKAQALQSLSEVRSDLTELYCLIKKYRLDEKPEQKHENNEENR